MTKNFIYLGVVGTRTIPNLSPIVKFQKFWLFNFSIFCNIIKLANYHQPSNAPVLSTKAFHKTRWSVQQVLQCDYCSHKTRSDCQGYWCTDNIIKCDYFLKCPFLDDFYKNKSSELVRGVEEEPTTNVQKKANKNSDVILFFPHLCGFVLYSIS